MIPAVFAAPKSFTWTTPTAEELAETAPKLEPGAAAELLLNRIEVDDGRDGSVRLYHTHQRYKIYDPERAAPLLSLSYWESDANRDGLTYEAQLVLPSGEVKKFNQGSFLERSVEKKSADQGILRAIAKFKATETQKYLPIAGVERGAILEVQMRWQLRGSDIPSTDIFPMQFEETAVRQAEYVHRCQHNGRRTSVKTLHNVPTTKAQEDDRMVIRAAASSLPAIHIEPHSGPLTDYADLVILAIQPDSFYGMPSMPPEELKTKRLQGRSITTAGRWLGWASTLDYVAKEYGRPTARIKKLAAEICSSASTPQEKAQRIHHYVTRLCLKYHEHTDHKKLKASRMLFAKLGDVLDFEKLNRELNSEDFILLAYSLNKAAGLDAYLLALPNRSFMRFEYSIVTERQLLDTAIGLYIDGSWYFSSPHSEYALPFNLLPPTAVGQVALVGQCAEEFIPVPFPPAETTTITQSGKFKLDTDGCLTGTATASLSGYIGAVMRSLLNALDEGTRNKLLQEFMGKDFSPSASITVKNITGLGEIDGPLVITFDLTWEGFATKADDRLILKPSVFHASQRTPFTASTRKAPIVFDFKWREIDQLELTLPADYSIEAPSAPQSYPNKYYNYTVSLKYSKSTHRIILDREFSSNCAETSTEGYLAVRELHARFQKSDQHELILKRKAPGSTAAH